MSPIRGTKLAVLLSGAACLSGCHSPFIQVTIQNRSGSKIQLLEMDYPSASFGVGELADGAEYHYRFKIIGAGPAKLTWTDAQRHEHVSKGPDLQEREEGTLGISLGPNAAKWQSKLQGPTS